VADFNADYYDGGSEALLVQNPVGADYYGAGQITVVANVRYYQRVFDTGTAGWCYYSTLNALDAAPASSATSPNWTGTISDSQVLSAVAEP
jgi:hypothetical protein